MSRDLRYSVRRLRAALIAAAAVGTVLLLFFFPATLWKEGIEFISFRPLWQLDDLPPDATGLVLQGLLVLTVAAGLWALYPGFWPRPPE